MRSDTSRAAMGVRGSRRARVPDGVGQGLVRGRLDPSCERRAKELLAARIDGVVSVADVAAACGLSRTCFSRAFQASNGVAPHRWSQQRRIDRAKALLAAGEFSIAEVALACGFADQSHLTRTFSKLEGIAPAAWRRRWGSATRTDGSACATINISAPSEALAAQRPCNPIPEFPS